MELSYALPTLEGLDGAGQELLLACIYSDELPPRGAAGLVDWRQAGEVSRLVERGTLQGELGDVVLMPGKPGVSFDKVVLLGCGKYSELDESVFQGLVRRMLRITQGLRARRACVELPGRHHEGLGPNRSVEILMEEAQANPDYEVWTLIEPAAAQKQIVAKLAEARRRPRTAEW